jgi:RNA polymerase sigma factor (sigma-70 family)
MSEAHEQEPLVEILKRARRGDADGSAGVREENLRRLVRAAMPEVEASAELRRRVEAMIAAHRARRPSLLARYFPWLRARELAAALREQRRWRTAFTESERKILGLLLAANMGPLPEAAVRHAEAQALIRRFVSCLPEPEREAFVLQVVHDLPIEEIARITGRSVKATGRLLDRARARIRFIGMERAR